MADPTLGTATLRTRVDTAGLQTGLRNAETDVRRFGSVTGAQLQAAARVGATAVAGITTAAVAAGGALVAAANKAAQYADEVDKAALRTRLSTDTVQELRFVTDQLGGSFATIESSVEGFTRRLASAEQGGERQIDAFNRLGIAVRDASGELRSQEDLLFESLEALSGVTNETEQAVLAQELFGRSAAQLGPILAAGAGSIEEYRQKARELGLVMDRESVTSLVAYKDQLSEVQQQFGAVTREVALGFLPLLTESLLPALQSAIEVFRGLPEPLQRSITGLTALGAAGTAAAAAFRVLGISTAALFGPAGLIIAGVSTIAVLGASLAGNRDSLTNAVDQAQAALASGDQSSFLGALDRIIARTDDGARPALERLRADLIQTGDVGIEQAARIIAAVEQFNLSNRNIFGLETRGQLELQLTLIGNRVGQDFVTAYESAIGVLDFEGAATVLEGAIAAAVESGVRRGDLERVQPVLTDLREFIDNLANLPTAFIDPGSRTGVPSGAGAGAPAGTPGDPVAVTFGPQSNFPTGLAAELALRNAPRNVVPDVFDSRSIPIPGVTSTQPTQSEIQAARAANNALRTEAVLAAAALGVFTRELDGLRTTRLIPTPNVSATVAGAVPIPIPGVTATGQTRSQLQALASEANAVELAAIKSEAALRSYTQSLEELGRIVTIPRPAATAAVNLPSAGGVIVPPTTPAQIQGFIDAGAKVRLELAQGAEAARLGAIETRKQIVTAGLQFATNLGSALRSGDPGSIFGAATGGIASIIGLSNPLAGTIFGLVGGIAAGLIPGASQGREDAQRAAGAAARGAPAIEMNVNVQQNLNVQSLTDPASRAAVDGLLTDTVARVESVLTAFGTRLRNVETRLA